MRSVDQKCCSSVSIRRYQKCGSAVLLKLSIRSAKRKCGSKVLLKSVIRSVAQKCCSEKSIRKVSLRSVAQKSRPEKSLSEVLLRSVDQTKCGSEVLIRCRSKSSLRSVKGCSEVLMRRVPQKCRSEVSMLLRSVAQKCEFSSVAQKCR